jgi:hypothetical protein
LARIRSTIFTSWVVGLILLLNAQSAVFAQAEQGAPLAVSVGVLEQGGDVTQPTWRPTTSVLVSQSRPERSVARTVGIHTAVGTGAGLIIGLALSGAGADDDRAAVVLTWTAVGAVAGVGSGVVTWLVGRRQ